MTDTVNGLSGAQDLIKACSEIKIEDSRSPNKCEVYELFFLMNDGDQTVWVMETSEIDLEEVLSCLKQGDSVFIHCKKN